MKTFKHQTYLYTILVCATISLLFSANAYAQDPFYEADKRVYESHMEHKRWNILADSAKTLEDRSVIYDPSYVKIPYPNGDVPEGTGVCTDVITRAYRKAFNVDLQKTVHDFLKRKYPDRKLDTNIDHRRVRNLMEYFDEDFDLVQLYNIYPDKYQKGNIIIWNLGGGQLHIGICVEDNMIIHNICCGQVIEPMYMQEKVIRNYNFRPDALERSLVKRGYKK